MGGFAADKFGTVKTTIFSLGIAAALFLISSQAVPGIIAVLLFNMTMPITLWVMAKIFPGAKGFSFGLLTFALFLGFLPKYIGIDVPAGAYWIYALGTLLSLVFLLAGILKWSVEK